MQYNPTPRNIAVYTSLILSSIVGIFSYILSIDLVQALATMAIVMIASYFLYFYSIEVFIYRKIKLIYKNIHTLKSKKLDALKSPTIGNTDPISAVNKEVMRWAADKREEIEALQNAEQFRKDFLGNVSHELKTPLFIIQGYISTLLEVGTEDAEQTQKFLKKASKSVDRLAALVHDLEMITMLESGFITIEKEEFDIEELCREVFDSLQQKAAEKNISIDFKETALKHPEVSADKDRIRQVLNNLIYNAIKYSNENTDVRVGLYDMDENILVEVSDKGIGMAEEHLPRLFERFYRVDKGRSRSEGGTGLGLSIVKHIIEAHNQTINVRSSVGIGSTFGFTIQKG